MTTGPSVPPSPSIDEVRTRQRRWLATIRGAIPGQVGEPLQGLDDLGRGATEWQVRLVVDELLIPHLALLAELEIDGARDAVEKLARRQSDNAWVDDAVRSIVQRYPSPFDRPSRIDPSDPNDREAVEAMRDAAALLDFADLLARPAR